jgi:hypothetical protein
MAHQECHLAEAGVAVGQVRLDPCFVLGGRPMLDVSRDLGLAGAPPAPLVLCQFPRAQETSQFLLIHGGHVGVFQSFCSLLVLLHGRA